MTTIKTYRRDDAGVLHYRESWDHRGTLFCHDGKVGTKGKTLTRSTRSRTFPTYPTMTELRAIWLDEVTAHGYAPIEPDDHGWVVLQVWTHTDDLSHPGDAALLDEVQDGLNDFIGWRGIGEVDGNDVGGVAPEGEGTMVNLFCTVVDTAIGVKVVRAFLREHPLTQRHIVGSREHGDDTDYVLAWSPRKQDKEFSLF